MNRFPFLLLVLSAFLLGALALWMARHQWEPYEHDEAQESGWEESGDRPGELLPLEEIIRRLALPARSRILEVEREREEGALYYEIEFLLPDGRIEEMMVDPRTGRVVKRKYERRDP